MDYDFFYDEKGYISDILNESVDLPPAIRDYSAGVYSHVSRMMFRNMFPRGTEGDYEELLSGLGKHPSREPFVGAINAYPLEDIPGFRNVQKNLDIDAWTHQGRPVKELFPSEEWGRIERGVNQFKGLKTVGQLRNLVTSSFFGELMQMSATRNQWQGGRNPLGDIGEMVATVMSKLPFYDPGTDIIKGNETPNSVMSYLLSQVSSTMGKIIDPTRQKDPLGMRGINANIEPLQLPAEFTDPFSGLVRTIPGQQPDASDNSYQMTGLFTKTGRPFIENSWQLNPVSMTPKRGWKPITVEAQDIQKLDTLFAHTAHERMMGNDQPVGLSYNAYKANQPIIGQYRDYFAGTPRDLSFEAGRTGYTVEESTYARNQRVYSSMPQINPTGYYFDSRGNLSTYDRPQQWPTGTRTGDEYQFSFRSQEYTRRQLTLSPVEMRFLRGEPTATDIAQNPSLLRKYPVMPQPAGYEDPYALHRRAANKIFNTYSGLLGLGPSATYDSPNALQAESDWYAREFEQRNTGMMLQHTDAYGTNVPLPRSYTWVPRAGTPSNTEQALNLAMRGVGDPYGYRYNIGTPQSRQLSGPFPMSPLAPRLAENAVDPQGRSLFPFYGRAEVNLPQQGISQQRYPTVFNASPYMSNDVPFRDLPVYDRGTGIVIPMNYSFRNRGYDNSAPWLDAGRYPTTYDAIKAGLRTATTRWMSQNPDYWMSNEERVFFTPEGEALPLQRQGLLYDLEFGRFEGEEVAPIKRSHYPGGYGDISGLRRGDIASVEGPGGRTLSIRITSEPQITRPNTKQQMEEWSRAEGWSTRHGEYTFGRKGPGYQIGFELASEINFRNINVVRRPTGVVVPKTQVLRVAPEHMYSQANIAPESNRYYVNPEWPQPLEGFIVPSMRASMEEKAMNDLVNFVKGEAKISPYNAAIIATTNLGGRNKLTPKGYMARQNIDATRSDAIYSASQNYLRGARQQVAMPDDPLFHPDEETAYVVDPRPSKQAQNPSNYMETLQARIDRVRYITGRRALIKHGDEAIKARGMEPTAIPADALSEQEAFAGSSSQGIAIGNYGYLRGEFITWDELSQQYSGMERLQKAYQVGRVAAYHEAGHIVLSKLPDDVKNRFSALFNKMVNKVGQEGMLSADVEGKKFNFSEEFSAAYSIAATLGSDSLKEFYPDYAKFFADNWEAVEEAENGVTIIKYKGDKTQVAFRQSRQLEVHGELPVNDPLRAWQERNPLMTREELRERYPRLFTSKTLGRHFLGEDDTVIASLDQVRQRLQSRYPIGDTTFTPQAAGARAIDMLTNLPDELVEKQWGASKLKVDQMMLRGGIFSGSESNRGEEIAGSTRVRSAIETGRSAFSRAISQGNLPQDQTAWAASMLERVNKFVEDTYKQAISQAKIGGEKTAVEALRNVSKGVAEQYVMESGGVGKPMQKVVRDYAYGASGHRITSPEMLMRAAQGDPEIARMVASGDITPDMTTGPAQVFPMSGGGAVRVGGAGGGFTSFGQRAGMWSGKAGQALYASYIMRRMWSMIAAPELQASQEYQADMAQFAGLQAVQMAQAGGGAPRLTTTAAGQGAQQAAVQSWMQRGAWQQWGGFTTAGYALSGSGEMIPRAMSGLRVAAGAGVTGMLAGQAIGMMAATTGGMIAGEGSALASLGAAAPTIGLAIGGAMALGTVGMEIYNAAAQPEIPMSWGGVARGTVNWWNYSRANQRALIQAGFNADKLGLPGAVPQMDREKVLSQMTPQARAAYEYQGEPRMMRDVREQLEAVRAATGEDVGGMQASVRALARNLNGVPAGMADIAFDWSKIGLTVAEGTQAFVNLANQMGYTPGTQAYRGFWDQYNSVASAGNVTQYEQMMARGQRVSQFGGQISGYYNDPKQALQLTDKFDLTTASKMSPVQSLLATAASAGITADTVIGYNASDRFEMKHLQSREVTFDTAIAQLANRRGTWTVANVDQPLAAALMASGYNGQAAIFAGEALGFRNTQQVSNAQRWLQTANLYGQGYGGAAGTTISPIANISNYAAATIPGMAEPLMRAGYENVMGALAEGYGNLPGNIQYQISQAAGGNLNMQSYLANRQVAGQRFNLTRASEERFVNYQAPQGIYQNPYAYMSRNIYGQRTYMTDFSGAAQFGAYWEQQAGGFGGTGAMSFQPAAQLAAGGDTLGAVNAFFGDIQGFTPEAAQAWASGGLVGRTLQHNAVMRGYQAQSASMAGAGAALSARFLWGGGAWTGTPAAGSIWDIQDRMRQMGYANQMQNFQYQRQMMQTQNQFAIRGENLAFERMGVTQDYQRWQSGFQFGGMMLQRQWTQQDWQYSDQMRNMQFGWNMEDLDTAIRTSTGRQRAQLVKQRERASTQFNMEGEQIDKTRDRQEELWAREDEQYAKQKDYQETMMELDRENFELNKEQRETIYEMEKKHFEEQVDYFKERFELETTLIAKQRDYQAAQIALQGAQAALQKKMAEEQASYSEEVERMTTSYEMSEGYMKTIVEAEPEKIFASFSKVVLDMNKLSGHKLQQYSNTFNDMNNVSVNILNEMQNTFSAMNSINPSKLHQIATELWRIANTSVNP